MLRNYILVAWRNLMRNRVTSLINISGLAIGMSVAILIALYVTNEYQYDRWIADSENIHRVFRQWTDSDNKSVWTPSLLGQKVTDEFAEVSAATSLGPYGESLVHVGEKKLYTDIANVDSTFFNVFEMPFKYGQRETSLDAPKSMVLSNEFAERMFGDIDPVGKTIGFDGDEDYRVTGVLDSDNRKSHLIYDVYVRFTWASPYFTGNNRATYVRLHPRADISAFEEKMTKSVNEEVRKEYEAMQYDPNQEDFAQWRLQNLNDIHLYSADHFFIARSQGNIRFIRIYVLIGVLVLSIAIINYINLATAQATQRRKEVGVRKVTGAERSQLVGQFLTEAIVQSMISLAGAIILARFLLPIFNTISSRDLELSFIANLPLLATACGLALIVGFLSGIYPALVVSGFSPSAAFRDASNRSSSSLLRKILVSGQFVITTGLIVIMAFVYKQIQFMEGHDLNFNPEQVISIPLNDENSHRLIESRKSAFKQIPGVLGISTASGMPGSWLPDWGVLIKGRDEGVYPNVMFTDGDFDEIIDLKVLLGRFLSEQYAADSIDNFVVNETFVRQYGIEDPIGAEIKFSSAENYGRIVGVIKDYHFQGLNRAIRPLVFTSRHDRNFLAVKINTNDVPGTISALQSLWPQIEPTHPMRYSFLDEDFSLQYAEHRKFGKTVLYATVLTIFLAIMGLIGLTTFTVERRTKEIGIRKVLGASVTSIVELLSRDFLKLVLIAFLVAIPLAYSIVNMWLQDFAFRTEITWWVFLLSGLAIALIVILTVGLQSSIAATKNPVAALRTE